MLLLLGHTRMLMQDAAMADGNWQQVASCSIPAILLSILHNQQSRIFGQQCPTAEGHISRQGRQASTNALRSLAMDKVIIHERDLAHGHLQKALHQTREMVKAFLGEPIA